MVKQLKCQLVRWRNLFPETGLKGLQSDVLRMYISIGCTGSRYGWEKMRHWISLAPRQLWLESSQLVVPWWPDNVSEISETDQGGTDMNSSHHATAWGLDIREVSGVEMAYRRQFPFTIHKISEDIHVQTLEEKQIYDILCIVNIHEYSLFINIRYLWLEIFWVCSFCCFCCSGSRHHVRTLTAFGSRRDFVAARPLGVFQALGVAWPTQTPRIFEDLWHGLSKEPTFYKHGMKWRTTYHNYPRCCECVFLMTEIGRPGQLQFPKPCVCPTAPTTEIHLEFFEFT